jgi:MacB-like periplasmic core domain
VGRTLTGGGIEFQVEAQRDLHKPPEEMRSYRLLVSPGFFDAMGTPLLTGRDLGPQDNTDNSPMVALVNETFARRFVSAANPVGQHVRILESQTLVDVQIIGMVKDTTAIDPREARPPMYYEPYRERSRTNVTLALRVDGTVTPVMAALHRLARGIDSRWSLKDVAPFSEIEDRALVIERLVAQTSAAFGGLAVLVAAIGLYGVLALGVVRRTKDRRAHCVGRLAFGGPLDGGTRSSGIAGGGYRGRTAMRHGRHAIHRQHVVRAQTR